MTGELFALLRKHGLLAAQIGGEVSLGQLSGTTESNSETGWGG